MQRSGRKPARMAHCDFDDEYARVSLRPDGRDVATFYESQPTSTPTCSGAEAYASKREADEHRVRFVEMFERLRRDHGVRFDLAHNMTFTPENLDQVGSVVKTAWA